MADAAHLPGASKGEATAARIRAVALDQFSRLGFERVTLGGIAKAAKVSQPALHYHFQDKAQLWRSAMLALSAVIGEEERLLAALSGLPAVTQLRAAMRLFLQISRNHPALGRIVALEGMAGGERLEWLNRHLIGPRNRRMVELAAQAVADGDLRAFPPELVIITLQAGGVGVINLAPLLRDAFGFDPDAPAARAAHEEMILEAMLGGFLTEKGRARETAQ
jgi:AcrR family transcriptional regulator